MIEILLTILFCSMYCFGIYIITDDGMILAPIKNLAKKYLNEAIYKPLFGCPVCYASIHGGTMFYFISGLDYLLPAIVIIAGLNYIIVTKYA